MLAHKGLAFTNGSNASAQMPGPFDRYAVGAIHRTNSGSKVPPIVALGEPDAISDKLAGA